MGAPVEISEIVIMLQGRIDALVQTLFPAGRRAGHEWEVGDLSGNPGKSLKIHLTGVRAGVWSDFSAGIGGDALELVAQCLFAGDKAEAIRWARAWLGLDNLDPASISKKRAEAQKTAKKKKEHEAAEAARIRRSARRLYFDGVRNIKGTPVDKYLCGRGIDLSRLGRPPASIAYHAKCWNSERQDYLPAMIACISGAENQIDAVHRTWLEVRPDGSVIKAALANNKMTLGRYSGGMIRLWRGASGKSLSHAPEGDQICITEGLEDGLTIAVACPELRIGVAVSVSNMASIKLPPSIGTVIIAAQNDEPGSPADKALWRAVDRFLHQGRIVRVARSPVGKDVNDLIRGVG